MSIENWAEYKNWIETVIGAKKDYYYRGQRDPSWKLQTTFHRYSIGLKITLLQYLDNIIPEVQHSVSAHCNEIFDLYIRKGTYPRCRNAFPEKQREDQDPWQAK